MADTVDVAIPVDAEVAKHLDTPARREAVGRYLSGLLNDGRVCNVLAATIAEPKREAHARSLTDEEVDGELEAWRAKHQD